MAAVEPQVDPSTAAQVLYERHSGRLFGYFVHQLGSRDEAEDALQTTFLHAVRGLRRGVVPVAEWPWLLTIARNVCFTRWETARRRRSFETPRDPHVIEERAPAAVETTEIPLQQALAALPEQQRRAIVMREWQGLSYREIADELGVTVGAVESLLFRARGSLAKQLRGRRALDLGSLLAGAKSLFTGGAVAFKIAVIAAATGATVVAGAATLERGGDSAPKAPVRSELEPAPTVFRAAPIKGAPPTPRAVRTAPEPWSIPPPGETFTTPSSVSDGGPRAAASSPPAAVPLPSLLQAPSAPSAPVPPTAPALPEPPAPTTEPLPALPAAPSTALPQAPSLPTSPLPEPSLPAAPTISTDPVTKLTDPVVEEVSGVVDPVVEEVSGVVEGVVEELPVPAPTTPVVSVPETPTVSPSLP